ncbi:MAG: hypothetical protein CML16_12275 [Pusillimonas sp.]|nr:hypothetical protein [Pusillimonas sp.]MBC42361.1 hypothetical protein [Pusillimonas sp.]HCP78020.1 hypothetical protein [Pusillimonas sp.]|tara:strand:- start:8912 stop:9214 length:303 start_codon:yes stop_codon:yes gene_type:complete
MMDDRYSNVTSITNRKEKSQKSHDFLRTAEHLIAENAVENETPKQRVIGDNNLQISSDTVALQCVQGSGNIQISVSDDYLALVLKQLLKKAASISATEKK